MSIDDDLRAAERAGDLDKASAIKKRIGSRKIERFLCYPVGPKDETEEQRDARVKATPDSDLGESYWFWCEPCGTNHSYRTKNAKGESGPTWTFNGDMEKPTFMSSLLVRSVRPRDGKINPDWSFDPVDWVCHLFVVSGQIQYCGDCTHDLRGRTVPLPDLP